MIDTFYSVHVWGPSVHILQGWIQSMINYLKRNVFIVGDMVFSSIVTPNVDRNTVQIAILKLSRRIQFSPEAVENVQWGWNRNFIRCLRKIADGSRGKLIWRVPSYDNRLVSFSNFFSHTFVDPVRFSCQTCTNLTFFQRKAMSQSQQNPRKKNIFSVYTFNCIQIIFYQDKFKVSLNT